MTEIPEHLLKRSKERRAAKSGADAPAESAPAEGTDAPAAAPAAAAPTPAARAPEPLPTLEDRDAGAPPDIPVVAAAKRRKRVPYWAAAVLVALPLWAFIYVYAVQPPEAGASDPLVIGAEVYGASCQGCHGGSGEGGSAGQQLNDGHVLDTFADPLTMAHWIGFGAAEGARPDGTYGDLDRPGGAMNISDHPGQMQAFASTLSPEEIAAVTIYIREELAGGDPADDPNFNVETFTEDPAALTAMVQQVIDLGATGEPDLTEVEGAETGE